MLTKTELIEKFENHKYFSIPLDISEETIKMHNEALDFAVKLAEQLPNHSELQAENEVLKLALKNAVRSKLYYEIGNIGISENSSLWSDLPYKIEENISLFIDQAKQQILEGKR